MSKLTLETIAELSGVSRSTVSRVVNENGSVSPEVRERVLDIISQTGYRPNMAARSLVKQQTGLIGLVIPRAVQSFFTDPYFPRLIQGITQASNQNGFMLTLFLFHDEEEEQLIYPHVLDNHLVDGVIISSSVLDDPLVSLHSLSTAICHTSR